MSDENEALDLACSAFWNHQPDGVPYSAMKVAIATYLEARGAVLCDVEPDGWWIGYNSDDEFTTDPEVLKAALALAPKWPIIPLHAALQDSPPIIRVEGETQ